MFASWLSRARSLWHGVANTHAVDAEMREEFRHHIELRAADLVRHGLSPADALRTARIEFGGTYQYTTLGREARGLWWFDSLRFSWLDVKFGARMLIKYPGLTVVSALAMGVAIAIGAGGSTAIELITNPALPLHEGDRIVSIQMMDVATRNVELRILRDVADWRDVPALRDVGVFRPTVRNITSTDGRAEVVRGVEMSAAGFRLARVRPLLGRYLVEDDERSGAPPVLVIGYDVWRARFAADSGIIGRTMRFGAELHTVVGVMPDGFAFPINYDLWVAPRISVSEYGWRQGPSYFAFARLAPGATLEQAQTELEALAVRMAAAHSETHRTLRPRVLPFSQSWFGLDDPDAQLMLRTAQLFLMLLLVVICFNVAILVYARVATRQSEIAVRSALGASRGRIVTQLFGEALVLSAFGAAVGLGLVWMIGSRLDFMLTQVGIRSVPFWLRFAVSDTTLVYLVALTVLGAIIIGVIPALRLTGSRVQLSLQRLAGGHATIRMGRTWTALVITQVALAVAILPAAVRFAADWIQGARGGPGFAAEQYLSTTLSLEQTPSGLATPESRRTFLTRFARTRVELVRRLEAEPEVIAATFMRDVPGSEEGGPIEIDSLTQATGRLWYEWRDSTRAAADGVPRAYTFARTAGVDASFFRVFGVRILAGRALTPADTIANNAIVNRSFIHSLLGGRSALGRRVRTVTVLRDGRRPGPWQEIVGVADDFPAQPSFDTPPPAIYHVARNSDFYPATLAVRTRGDPAEFGGRLRAIALNVEPAMLVRDVGTLDARIRAANLPLQWLALALGAITLSVLMLSSAGIYALMSVTVTRRRREIGIRVALGADRRHLLSGIFMRAIIQLVTGVATGIAVAAIFNSWSRGELLGAKSVVILPAVSLFMVGVGVFAAMVPARQALSIQPTVVLKEE